MLRKSILVSLAVVGSVLGSALFITNQSSYAATPADACFGFTPATGTITSYTVGGANNCPTDVDIPSTIGGTTVTAIGANAFSNQGITAVTFPSTITDIGTAAFSFDPITSLDIPGSVTSIGGTAFQSNAALTSLTLHEGLQSIGASAFLNITGTSHIGSLAIPNSVTSIGSFAFLNTGVTSLTLGTGLTSLPAYVFAGDEVKEVTVPSNIASIASTAFAAEGGNGNAFSIQDVGKWKQTYYTKLYTADPSNPNNLQDALAVTKETTDINGNGVVGDYLSLGGYVVNPASVIVTYKDMAGAELQPTLTRVGSDVSDYLIKNDSNQYTGATSDTALLAERYYQIGGSVDFIAPEITGYTLDHPASPATLELAKVTNILNFVYSSTSDGSSTGSTGEEGSSKSDEDLADTGTNMMLPIVGAVIMFVIAGGAFGVYHLKRRSARR